jgi:iron complex outermembrane receptor protein
LFTHNNRLVLRNYWSQATWQWPSGGSVRPTLHAGWSRGAVMRNTELHLEDAPAFMFLPNYEYQALSGGANVDWTLIDGLTLSLGVDAEHDQEGILYYTQIVREQVGQIPAGDRTDVGIDADDPRSVVLQQVGAYLQARAVPLPARLPGLRFTGNFRVDAVRQGDINFPLQKAWRAAAVYEFSPTVATRFIAGQAFQTPSAVLTFSRPGFGTVGNIVGNDAVTPRTDPLTPQTVTSAEVATTVRLFEVVALEGGVYVQELRNPIEFTRYAANYRAVNRDEARRNAGVEATLRYAESRLSTYLSGSFQRAIVDGNLVSDPLPGFPNTFCLVGADLKVPEAYLFANAELRWVSERGASQANVWVNNDTPYTLPAYGLVDVTLSTLELGLLGDTTETRFALGVRNLLDAQYSEPGYGGFDIPSLGRRLFAEARLIM